jgi:hypothetical protein
MADFEHRFADTVSRESSRTDFMDTAHVLFSSIETRPKVFSPVFWVSGLLMETLKRAMNFTDRSFRVGSNGGCFEQQPSCGQILQEGESFDRVLLYIGANVRQLSISGWCLIFMLGAILQVVATQDVAYIYGR